MSVEAIKEHVGTPSPLSLPLGRCNGGLPIGVLGGFVNGWGVGDI